MRIAVASEGDRFDDRALGLALQWPRGGGARGVAEVADDREAWTPALRAAFDSGRLVEAPADQEPGRPRRHGRKAR